MATALPPSPRNAAEPAPYRETLFDRHGPDAGRFLRALGYGILVGGIVASAIIMRLGFHWWTLPVAVGVGSLAGSAGWIFSAGAGKAWSFMMVEGGSTPYVEQYSYQQAIVMKGQVDEALESFEAVVAETPENVVPRIKAAELYAKERKNFRRAAELFREVQRIPAVAAGEDIYATSRLVDLLVGPLGDPGRA